MKNQPLILRVGNIWVDIIGELPDSRKKELEKKLSFRPQGFQFSPFFNKWHKDEHGQKTRRIWDGWKRQFWSNTRRTYFPTGLYSVATEYFKDHSISFVTQDIRQSPPSEFEVEDEGFTYRDYQQHVIDTACNRSRGIIQMATGGGKTVVAAGIIGALKVSPFMFFVTLDCQKLIFYNPRITLFMSFQVIRLRVKYT